MILEALPAPQGPQAPVDPLTDLSAARFGVYVHFPFCLSKCPYCDFASVVARQVPDSRYADTVVRELALRLEAVPALRGREVQSVFFGGGTPSLWDPRYVGQVLEAISDALPVADRAEVTLEANPGASDSARFAGYRAAGVNRLSIGVQSFEAGTLKALGRAHDGDAAEAAFRSARAAGFRNLSMDFIYGVQGQTLEGAMRDARRAAALEPEHLSAYALTLDRESLAEEVPLARQLRRGEVSLPPDDAVVAMAGEVREIYGRAGIVRYETSNFARPGHHSRHNALYWTGGEYLALGCGATGHWREGVGGIRYANHRSVDRYLEAVDARHPPESGRESLSRKELFEERLAMGLRLANGVDLEAVCAEHGEPFEPRRALVQELVQHGLAWVDGKKLCLTARGADLHSEISARLL